MQAKHPIYGFGALVVALLIALYLAFSLGGFDSVVRGRAMDIAQMRTNEWVNDWFGGGLLQYPNDLMTYQQIVSEVRPDVIIETGTYIGGLTVFLSSLLDHINPDGKVISIVERVDEIASLLS